MKFTTLSMIIGAAIAQDEGTDIPCEKSSECKTDEVVAALNEVNTGTVDITMHTATCMTVTSGDVSQSLCGAIDFCDSEGTKDGEDYIITCEETADESEDGASKVAVTAAAALFAMIYSM